MPIPMEELMRSQSKFLAASILIFVALLAVGLLAYEHGFRPNKTVAAAAPDSGRTPRDTVSGMQSYADTIDRVAPAVVTIRSARRTRAAQQFPFLADPFFRQFFGDQFRNNSGENRSVLERALGSGVIVKGDGHIITNHHVVDGADQISVELTDHRTFEAKVLGSDSPSDLAVLKIAAAGLPVLTLGNSDKVRVGDICLAIGNPLGIGETVTFGIVSARGRATGLSDGSFEDFLQTDAAINQGNSGGALIDTRGELIGINSQIVSPSGGNIGIGFAIPSNMARNVMDQLSSGGRVHRGKLGIGIQAITSDLAKGLKLKDLRGVLVNSVEPGGPGEQAGLHAGDVITAVDKVPVNDSNGLRNRIAGTPPGTNIALTIERDGKEMQLSARLGELPVDKQSSVTSSGSGSEGRGEELGIAVQPLTEVLSSELKLPRGTHGLVVTGVDPAGPAAEAGVQQDDVILEVDRQPVGSVSEFRAAIRRTRAQPVLLLLNRNGRNVFLAVRAR